MDTVIHLIGLQTVIQPFSQAFAIEIRLHVQSLHAFEEPVEVLLKKQHSTLLDTEAFPDAIT